MESILFSFRSCTRCHNPMAPETAPSRGKAPQVPLSTNCHFKKYSIKRSHSLSKRKMHYLVEQQILSRIARWHQPQVHKRWNRQLKLVQSTISHTIRGQNALAWVSNQHKTSAEEPFVLCCWRNRIEVYTKEMQEVKETFFFKEIVHKIKVQQKRPNLRSSFFSSLEPSLLPRRKPIGEWGV